MIRNFLNFGVFYFFEKINFRLTNDITIYLWTEWGCTHSSFNNEARHLCPLIRVWFTDMFLKPVTHYSSLFANTDKTTFLRKKLSFAKRDEERCTYFCHRPQFSWMCVATKNITKKVLWIRQKLAYFGKRISQKTFAKRSRIWRITLYTLFAFGTNFICSFLFSHASWLVCSGLESYETRYQVERLWDGTFEYTYMMERQVYTFHYSAAVQP